MEIHKDCNAHHSALDDTSTLDNVSLNYKMPQVSGASNTPRVWLVTGCSQGFGRFFVKEISSRGDKVIATARSKDAIADLGQLQGVKTMQLDVTNSQEVLDGKLEEALGLHGTIDVLVNNAGYVLSGVWEELSYVLLLIQSWCRGLIRRS